jgi:hypothetical protein
MPDGGREARPNPQQSSGVQSKEPAAAAVPEEGRLERVRQRAYELYVGRGTSAGDDVADWLEAERQIDAEGPR